MPKWVELMIFLYNTPAAHRYSRKIKQRIPIPLSHLRKLLLRLEESGLIVRKRTGKIQYLMLTEKGEMVADMLLKIRQVVKSQSVGEAKEDDTH